MLAKLCGKGGLVERFRQKIRGGEQIVPFQSVLIGAQNEANIFLIARPGRTKLEENQVFEARDANRNTSDFTQGRPLDHGSFKRKRREDKIEADALLSCRRENSRFADELSGVGHASSVARGQEIAYAVTIFRCNPRRNQTVSDRRPALRAEGPKPKQPDHRSACTGWTPRPALQSPWRALLRDWSLRSYKASTRRRSWMPILPGSGSVPRTSRG